MLGAFAFEHFATDTLREVRQPGLDGGGQRIGEQSSRFRRLSGLEQNACGHHAQVRGAHGQVRRGVFLGERVEIVDRGPVLLCQLKLGRYLPRLVMLELVRIGRQKSAGVLEACGRRLEILQSRLRACFFQQRQKHEAFFQRVGREVRRQRRGQLQSLLVPLQAIQRLAEIDPHAQYFPRRKRCRRLARNQAEQSFSVGEATGLQLDAPRFGKGRGCGCAIVIQIRNCHGLEQSERRVAVLPPPGMDHGDLTAGLHDLGEVLLGDGRLSRQVQMFERPFRDLFNRLNTIPLRRSTRGRKGELSGMAF